MANEIQLSSDGSQKLSTVISGVSYTLEVSYNIRMGVWALNISKDNSKIIDGIVLVAGINLLDQYTSELNNLFIINIDNPNQDPTDSNLGTNSRLFNLTTEEINQIG